MNIIHLKPTAGNVFIAPDVESDFPLGVIFKPEKYRDNKEMPSTGTVFAMGGARVLKNGVKLKPEFKIGDRVLFRKFSAIIFDVRGKRLLQLKQHDVEAVLG